MDKVIHDIANLLTNKEQKVIIGISGHGASGKTTFSNKLKKILGRNDVNYINTDPYIIGSHLRKYTTIDYEYKNEHHQYKMTACHPSAHNIKALERDINMMRDGLNFYTIGTDYMESTLISSQNKINIVEGMSVAFINPNLLDLKIFLYTGGDTELNRRGVRDVSERGTNINYLRQSHEERRIQYELFMHPYHQNFDVVLKNSNVNFLMEKGDYLINRF
ncbi:MULTISPECIES: uridine kinase family protein [Pontibacillus]|uniref:Phosphoribulokinase n=1 Tax=Pontibacillus marinus BH030004 = DSM 16465 TaxID=1385511 RepID=A0A0A5FWG8_9BACI|nr:MULTISPECIES: phosphoribulokinase [Pontibacillus]KGX83368.1 phosphoribulokinase [Pontibacillus marinus BH030004 = DSM 16465]QHE50886.1 phosphoribulokinase [Pontibacillus sp. HMF3514]QHE52752.1 phosphoribulokinase [Pontibacillus sp. HMF3514]